MYVFELVSQANGRNISIESARQHVLVDWNGQTVLMAGDLYDRFSASPGYCPRLLLDARRFSVEGLRQFAKEGLEEFTDQALASRGAAPDAND